MPINPASEPSKPRVLIFIRTYLPGTKAGGPVRSIANMIERMSDFCEFFVITRDRDIGGTEPYTEIACDEWNQVGAAKVFYLSAVGPWRVRHLLREVKPALVYLNSFHDRLTLAYLLLRRLRLVPRVRTLIAPRGEFSAEALQIKSMRKRQYSRIAKLAGLYEGLEWHATSSHEYEDILSRAPRGAGPPEIHTVHEFASEGSATGCSLEKRTGSVKLAFISRISPMKNLIFLLRCCRRLTGSVELNLWGPIAKEDERYWQACREEMQSLDGNVKVTYHGFLEHEMVPQVLSQHHFFVLPSLGENYCHAAVEALNNGIPVVLSDATPWRDLAAARAGFDIPLSDVEAWVAALQGCVDVDEAEYAIFRAGVQKYRERFSESRHLEDTKRIFLGSDHEADREGRRISASL